MGGPELIYLFPDSKRIDLYNELKDNSQVDLTTIPIGCENLVIEDYKLQNIDYISELKNLTAIIFKCSLEEFNQIQNENLKYIGLTLNSDDIFDCNLILKFPKLEELHIYKCKDLKNISVLENLNLTRLQIFQKDLREKHKQELDELSLFNKDLFIYSE